MVNDYIVTRMKSQSLHFQQIQVNNKHISKEDVKEAIIGMLLECDDDEIEWIKERLIEEDV